MTQWDYCEHEEKFGRMLFGPLQDLGRDGWELVTIISRPGLPERAYFKGPIVAKKAPAKKGTR